MKWQWTSILFLCLLFAVISFLFYARKTVVAASRNDNSAAIKTEGSKDQKQEKKDSHPMSDVQKQQEHVTPKKPITLQHVAAGFSHFAHQYKQKKEEKFELSITETRFLEKILQSVATMCTIYRNKLAVYLHEKTMLHCAVSLSKNGLIEQCTISKTSGNIMLDSLIKQIIVEAGTSFPPIPQSITKIPYYLIFQFDFNTWLSFTVLLPR